ncbi:hypothetical protein [Pseudodesulfovibrio sp. zrk46]|uniref:hypothetical protein n=1 Tax=Pseudodesulfovibrio sp. zrk46 TaxID=2725288 RepID=UPI001449F2FC|nr:hypothetical protein [Pseudodesulfovibrio sp. zrk46]QJB56160.1 hypothetical protein HFN16_06920 [Pseudodesulfovibrio sp. zrk46]
MPKLVYALMCADLLIDKDSNSTSFIRTIEHAVVPEFPTVLPPIYFASLWEMGDTIGKPFTVSLAITPPNGEETLLGIQEIQPGETMLHKMNFQLPGLKVEGEGKHTVSVAVKVDEKWETLAELPLFVFKSESNA